MNASDDDPGGADGRRDGGGGPDRHTAPFSPVPFTLQVPAVVLSGLLLGPRYGALAQAIYLLVGAVGVPVFAEFKGGLGVLLGPTGGYLLSYPIAAAVAGLATTPRGAPPRRRALSTASSGDAPGSP